MDRPDAAHPPGLQDCVPVNLVNPVPPLLASSPPPSLLASELGARDKGTGDGLLSVGASGGDQGGFGWAPGEWGCHGL